MALHTIPLVPRGQGTLQAAIRRFSLVPLSRYLLRLKALGLDHHLQLHFADLHRPKHVLVTHKSQWPAHGSYWRQILGTKRSSRLLERLNLHRLFDSVLSVRLRIDDLTVFNKLSGCFHDDWAIDDCVLAMARTFDFHVDDAGCGKYVSVSCPHGAPCHLSQVVLKSLLRRSNPSLDSLRKLHLAALAWTVPHSVFILHSNTHCWLLRLWTFPKCNDRRLQISNAPNQR